MSGGDRPLDRPIWEALSTTHASMAEGGSLAKRYPREVSPLAALREQSPEAYAALGRLLAPEEAAVLFLNEPPRPPAGWTLVRDGRLEQRVCSAPPAPPRSAAGIEPLGPDEAPEMLALAELTKPGPFRSRTVEFGGYIGIRDAGRLVAMAGQRTRPAGYTEISAVCTHPDARGRGHAEALIAALARTIFGRGEIPFLGVRPDNEGARRLYERLGFKVRAVQRLAVVAQNAPSLL
ncbi:MAG TPA: GNAT family N-acetyltransferase [Elusimicrobiota bacterium]|nr:GNAT family N-acetyltransferase [Elusimicrobiota bacterium]